MRFKRLKLVGFKSFVDPAELRIEPGLTGIVGPNGCGKSNLLEAMRWVMGEGSAKSLRGGGMEDVIFAGTAQRPARDFAEVQLFAERPDEEELEVVRRIERGAGSAYRLNGKDVRAKDVALLFADAATGAHSPALVSQGRIGAVISAKPVERRAMLEEAAGIAGLHVRRKDAEQKLRATEANLARLGELIGDIETRTGQLRRQARAAERYRAVSADIKVAEARLIFARWRDAAQAAAAAKREAADAEARVSEVAEAQRAAAAWSAEATRQLAEARAAAQAARDRASETGHKLATMRAELAAAERRLSELETARERLAGDRDREGALANDAADAIARLTAEAKALDTRIADNERQKPTLAAELAAAESAARDAEVALAQALSQQAREQADAQIARSAAASARARADRATRELAQVESAVVELGDDAALTASRVEAIARREAAERAGAEAAGAIEAAEAERAAAAEAREAAEAALSAGRAQLSALESEAAALERALQTRGGDRLIDHVRAAPGYERALAAALGDELETALGDWRESMPAGDPALPAGLETLAAHVTAPPVLARRLAQIGVAERDDGVALAPGQQLVTRDGTMRRWDGYAAAHAGAAAAERLIRANRLDALKAQLPEARAAVDEAEAAMRDATARLTDARTAAEAARRAQAAAEQTARAARREEDLAEAALERFAARRDELAGRLARARAERDEAARELATADAACAALPDGSATAERVATLSARSESARGAVSEKKALAATLDRALAADRERQAAAQAEAKGWRARAGEAAKRIEEMARREKAAEAERAALADAPARLQAQIDALAADQDSARADAETRAAAERAAEARVREGEATLAAAGEALAQAREQRAGAVARAEASDARRIEMGRVSGERFECPPPLLPERAGFDAEAVGSADAESARHDRLVLDRERLGPVNLVAEQELREIEGDLERSIGEREELIQAVNRLRGSIGSLNREGRARLLAAFEEVDRHFRRLFERLFGGGEAYLQLIDSDDPLEAGLEIMAQPPGKKLGSLTLLSGGEQALTAVALIFGLFLTNPAPICVLDEVDAPLDDANIERFCDLLDAMVSETDTRYLIVTHNAVTMSRMHRLFGVTMVERGVSRLVSVDLGGAEQLLAAE